MEVKPRAYFFEFLTHFSILKLDWSMKRHRHAITLAGAAHALSYTAKFDATRQIIIYVSMR